MNGFLTVVIYNKLKTVMLIVEVSFNQLGKTISSKYLYFLNVMIIHSVCVMLNEYKKWLVEKQFLTNLEF